MKKRNRLIAIVIIAIALAVSFVVLSGVQWGGRIARAPAPTQKIGANTAGMATSTPTQKPRVYTPNPPHGSVTYQIAQAATQLPGFLQATIDPADASVGQVQRFTIVTNDPNPITSVVAVITTDHKTITVPLVSQGTPAVSMLVPRTISVTSDNKLALVASGTGAPDLADTQSGAHVANAANSNDTKFTGQWTVEDTHTAKYSTKFIAKDAAGNQNSVTLQWTDPCPFATTNNYVGGTAEVNTTCHLPTPYTSISSVDGPENGNLLIDNGGTITVDSGATLIINSGYSINFSGNGTLVLPTGAQVLFNQDMYGVDNDGDGFIEGDNWSHEPYGSYSGTSRGNLGGSSPAQCSSPDPNCSTNQTVCESGYCDNGDGTTNADDCYFDGGNWTDCSGSWQSYSANYSFSSPTTGDCDDSDANVHPGQTGWFTNISNGGTWDYNCSGSVNKEYGTIVTGNCGFFTCQGAPNWGSCGGQSLAPGWVGGSIPVCGGTGDLATGCSSDYPSSAEWCGYYYYCSHEDFAYTPQGCN
jgi:hypothetical protein